MSIARRGQLIGARQCRCESGPGAENATDPSGASSAQGRVAPRYHLASPRPSHYGTGGGTLITAVTGGPGLGTRPRRRSHGRRSARWSWTRASSQWLPIAGRPHTPTLPGSSIVAVKCAEPTLLCQLATGRAPLSATARALLCYAMGVRSPRVVVPLEFSTHVRSPLKRPIHPGHLLPRRDLTPAPPQGVQPPCHIRTA
jgi:hypothetical protein